MRYIWSSFERGPAVRSILQGKVSFVESNGVSHIWNGESANGSKEVLKTDHLKFRQEEWDDARISTSIKEYNNTLSAVNEITKGWPLHEIWENGTSIRNLRAYVFALCRNFRRNVRLVRNSGVHKCRLPELCQICTIRIGKKECENFVWVFTKPGVHGGQVVLNGSTVKEQLFA